MNHELLLCNVNFAMYERIIRPFGNLDTQEWPSTNTTDTHPKDPLKRLLAIDLKGSFNNNQAHALLWLRDLKLI